ncbi:MAG: RNA polymerase sigma factor [Bacillota bacterium]
MEEKLSKKEIIKKYGTLVSSLCFKMIRNKDIAKEASQEVWLEVLQSLDSFEKKSKLSTWIYKIAYRVIIKYSRNEKKYSTSYLKECFDGPDLRIPHKVNYNKNIWVKNQCDKCLTGTLHCLDNEKRLIYIFREIAQLPYKEIAEIIGKKEANIRKINSRSKMKLENFLNDQCILFNPDGDCRCRIKKQVENIDLDKEYKKIKNINNNISFFQISEKIIPRKKFWKKFL